MLSGQAKKAEANKRPAGAHDKPAKKAPRLADDTLDKLRLQTKEYIEVCLFVSPKGVVFYESGEIKRFQIDFKYGDKRGQITHTANGVDDAEGERAIHLKFHARAEMLLKM